MSMTGIEVIAVGQSAFGRSSGEVNRRAGHRARDDTSRRPWRRSRKRVSPSAPPPVGAARKRHAVLGGVVGVLVAGGIETEGEAGAVPRREGRPPADVAIARGWHRPASPPSAPSPTPPRARPRVPPPSPRPRRPAARQRDARPFDPERPGIGLSIGGIVQGGEDMVEQIFRRQGANGRGRVALWPTGWNGDSCSRCLIRRYREAKQATCRANGRWRVRRERPTHEGRRDTARKDGKGRAGKARGHGRSKLLSAPTSARSARRRPPGAPVGRSRPRYPRECLRQTESTGTAAWPSSGISPQVGVPVRRPHQWRALQPHAR